MKLNLVRLMQIVLVVIVFLAAETTAFAQRPSWWVNLEAATIDNSLVNLAQAEVSVNELLGRQNPPINVIVIPIEAFEWALQDPAGVDPLGNRFYAVDDLIAEQIVQLNAISNHPNVHGAFANLKRPKRGEDYHFFQGDNFIVAMDAKLSSDGNRVEFTEYMHVGVQLRGYTSWLAMDATLATTGESLQAYGCCDKATRGQFGANCGFMGKIPGTLPDICTKTYCGGRPLDDLIQPRDIFDFGYGPPFVPPFISSKSPFTEDTWGTDVKRISGQPVKPLHILKTGPPIVESRIRISRGDVIDDPFFANDPLYTHPPFNPGLPDPPLIPGDPPVGGGGSWHRSFPMVAAYNRIACEQCDVMLFNNDQCFDSPPPIDGPPKIPKDPCSLAPSDVPPICQRINPGANASLCGGYGPDRHDSGPNNCNGPAGSGMRTPWTSIPINSPPSSSSPSCNTSSPYPSWCDKVMSDHTSECFVSKEARDAEDQFWINEVLGCRNGAAAPAPGVQCIEGGACETRGAVQFCIDCNGAGSCRRYVKKGFGDPRVMDENDTCDESVSCCGECTLSDEQADVQVIHMDPLYFERSAAKNEAEVEAQTQTVITTVATDSRTHSNEILKNHENSFILSNYFFERNVLAEEITRSRHATITSNRTGPSNNQTKEEPQRISDPVLIGDGSLEIVHKDFSLPGPVRPLEFTRTYNSRSTHRGILGSNWRHNFEARLRTITPAFAPTWAGAYCHQIGVQPNCILYEDGNGNSQIFYRDLGSKSEQIYMPQAGSTDTIVAAQNGWALRSADGHKRIFNNYGHMLQDHDRFGNGFTIKYEHTPLHLLYVRYCGEDASPIFTSQKNYDPRLCDVLAYHFNDGIVPDISHNGLSAIKADGFLAISEIQLPSDPLIFYDKYGNPLSSDGRDVTRARAFLSELLKINIIPENPTGNLRMRPTHITDNLGRKINFNYNIQPGIQNATSSSRKFNFGLLYSISGPEGVNIVFDYDRPSDPNYSDRIADMFLVNVLREDNVPNDDTIEASQSRTYSYKYAWPELDGSNNDSTYTNHLENVEQKYFALFSAYNGCNYLVPDICTDGAHIQLYQGNNPCLMTTIAKDNYAESVADNIVFVKRSEVIEVESKFVSDPEELDFDKVVSQRYGGLYSQTNSGGWKSGYPDFQLKYIQPSTAETISSILSVKYPLEVPPSQEEDSCPYGYTDTYSSTDSVVCKTRDPMATGALRTDMSCNNDTFKYDVEFCHLTRIGDLEASLPGNHYFNTYNYYEKPDTSPTEYSISQTHLSCGQIAAAQTADPLHTGLVAQIHKSVLENNVFVADYDQAGRQRIAKDVLRICQWVKATDRDDHVRYYGLNYRGQTLTEVIENSHYSNDVDKYTFLERYFNADGKLILEKDPHHGSQSTGYTEYKYDNIDPAGNNGHNAFIPGFWTRRNNLLEQKRTYLLGVENFEARQEDSIGVSLGYYTSYTYEPLFNQLRSIESGAVNESNTFDWHERVKYDFDYQELEWSYDSSDNSIASYLVGMIPYGWTFNYIKNEGKWVLDQDLKKEEGNTAADIANYLRDWQFPIHFYGTDLNGDGIQGFPFGEENSKHRVKGLPVRMTHSTSSQPAEETRQTFFGWARHGRIAGISSDDGSRTLFEYYSSGNGDAADKFGTNTQPPRPLLSAQNGYLARITTNRYDESYSLPNGQTAELSNDGCTELSGPYRYIIPGGCSSNPLTALTNLGVPQQIASELVTRQEHTTEAFSYNHAGFIKNHWSDGRKNSFRTDLDGRVVTHTDPQNMVTSIEYSKDGRPTSEIVRSQGEVLSHARKAYNAEGNLVAECHALEAGACDGVFSGFNSGIITDSSVLNGLKHLSAEDIQLNIYNYTPEGQLSEEIDPSGIATSYHYNASKQLTKKTITSATNIHDYRTTNYSYDVLGQLIMVTNVPSPIDPDNWPVYEAFHYDYAGRHKYHLDDRASEWLRFYDDRNRLTQIRLHYSLHIERSPVPEDWRHDYIYNGFGEVVEKSEHNRFVTKYSRTDDGRVYRIDRTGSGPTFVTFDSLGSPVWVRDAAGNAEIYLANYETNHVANISLRKDERNEQWWALSTSAQLDDNRQLKSKSIFDRNGDLSSKESWQRNSLGDITKHIANPYNAADEKIFDTDEKTIEYNYNLAGWVTAECEYSRETFNGCSDYTYYSDGQISGIVDPHGQVTKNYYSGFGQLHKIMRPGSTSPAVTWGYDGFGRPVFREDADGRQQTYRYDTGDLVETSVKGTDNRTHVERIEKKDAAGRIVYAKRANKQLQVGRSEDGKPGLSLEVEHGYEYNSPNQSVPANVVVNLETVVIGGVPRTTTYKYTYEDDTITKEITAPTQAVTTEIYDPVGRMTAQDWKTSLHLPDNKQNTQFLWNGHLYAGRTQKPGISPGNPSRGNTSPVREHAAFDDMGRRTLWKYTALDLNNPIDSNSAATYCNNNNAYEWAPANCSEPLLQIGLERNQPTGRVTEATTQYGFPNNSSRGHDDYFDDIFTYNSFGHLTGTEQVRRQDDEPDRVSSTQSWIRDVGIGSLNRIETDNTPIAWEATRTPAHRLLSTDDFANKTAVFGIQHDETGHFSTFTSSTNTSSSDPDDEANWAFDFDSLGQLIAVHKPGTALYEESYIYDHHNRLVGIIDDFNALTTYDYNGDNIVAAVHEDGDVLWEAAWGPGTDQLIAFHDIAAQEAHIPLVDYRNSIVATWNVTEQEVSQIAEYDPNGVVTLYDKQETEICSGIHCPNVSNLPFGFTSALRSPVTGLIHMRARWYSPQLGQFISPDPLGYIDSYNLYSYALFDPINNWDPYGLSGGGFTVTPGPGTWARDAGKAIERGADNIGQFFDNRVTEAQDFYGERYKYSNSNIVKYASAAGLVLSEVGGMLTPRDGQDVMLEVAMLGAGSALKAGKVGNNARKLGGISSKICSFTEDTPVLMCDGSLKPIQHVRAGEFVLSRSEETGEFGCREVVEPYSNPDKAIIRIELLALDGSVEVIEATANHPFYVDGRGWTRVDELDVDDFVPGSTGELLRIVALESTDRVETVFNFGVEEFHSYFVGELGAWVHNCFRAPWKSMTHAEQRHFKHVWDRANQRGWNLGHFREGAADDHRKAINSAIDYVKDNASSIEHSSNMFNNKRVPTTTYRWNSSPDGPVYWVTEITDGKIPHSLGISQ